MPFASTKLTDGSVAAPGARVVLHFEVTRGAMHQSPSSPLHSVHPAHPESCGLSPRREFGIAAPHGRTKPRRRPHTPLVQNPHYKDASRAFCVQRGSARPGSCDHANTSFLHRFRRPSVLIYSGISFLKGGQLNEAGDKNGVQPCGARGFARILVVPAGLCRDFGPFRGIALS